MWKALLRTYCLLLTACCLLFNAYCLLLTAYRFLLTAYYLPFTAYCLLLISHTCCASWPRAALPASYLAFSDGGQVRVCHSCDQSAATFLAALRTADLPAVREAYGGGKKNVNLRCPLVPSVPDGQERQAVMLPVHTAAASDALPVLRWLSEEMFCPLVGASSLTVGKIPKTVLRVAIERTAVDCCQWLVGGEDAAAHVGVPIAIPLDSGCSAAAVHRTLEAALKEGWRQRSLIALTLDGLDRLRTSDLPQQESAPAHAELTEVTECVVCLAAPREHVLIPCGHACVCEDCSGTITCCPLCRASIERAVRLFAD